MNGGQAPAIFVARRKKGSPLVRFGRALAAASDPSTLFPTSPRNLHRPPASARFEQYRPAIFFINDRPALRKAFQTFSSASQPNTPPEFFRLVRATSSYFRNRPRPGETRQPHSVRRFASKQTIGRCMHSAPSGASPFPFQNFTKYSFQHRKPAQTADSD